ncbi:hypothetical protein [Sphingomonas parapaucimobilis]|uniref:Uncharacterized protein n=1 Tax=Sphingomonas parapaucimobilis NBRC 15100 TaxID=1219049 RepID=A0A0A1W760_9SPHN|nr:hypothetical protein [Sphingomonas parapaucimobilis]GAM00739.1 hypothetical protein SP5_035_01410 [Sphingomonas parapaucimobilis NBRC 15100]
MNSLAYIAAQRAREVLQVGDRIQVDHCPKGRITVTMTGWSGDYFTSATHDDLIPGCIVKVNGHPMRFIRPEEEEEWENPDSQATARRSEVDRWDCGNSHLIYRTALRLIDRNRIRELDTMEFIVDAVRRAGPSFAAAVAIDLDEDVPF